MPKKKKKKKIPENYLKGSKNRSSKAAEIRRTAALYKAGKYIDIKAVQKSRVNQDVTKKRRSPLNEATKKALRKKAEGTRFKYGELASVYRKGQGAYLSSGSRNVSMAAWSMARVNSYMRGGPARKVDKDIYKRARK